MALLEFKGRPSAKELMWFGLVMLALFGAVGGMLLWRASSLTAATIVWVAGTALVIIFYLVRPFRLPIYLAWMFLVYPIGWLISHLLMGIIFFLLITPTALVMRLFGVDPLKRRLDREAPTYWVDLKQEADRSRYFRQF